MAGFENMTVRKCWQKARLLVDGVPESIPFNVLSNHIRYTLGVPYQVTISKVAYQTHRNTKVLRFYSEAQANHALHIMQTKIASRNIQETISYDSDFQPPAQPTTPQVPQPAYDFNPVFYPSAEQQAPVAYPSYQPNLQQAQQPVYGLNPPLHAQQQSPGAYPGYQPNLQQAQQPVYGFNPPLHAQQKPPGAYPGYQPNLQQAQQPVYGYNPAYYGGLPQHQQQPPAQPLPQQQPQQPLAQPQPQQQPQHQQQDVQSFFADYPQLLHPPPPPPPPQG